MNTNPLLHVLLRSKVVGYGLDAFTTKETVAVFDTPGKALYWNGYLDALAIDDPKTIFEVRIISINSLDLVKQAAVDLRGSKAEDDDYGDDAPPVSAPSGTDPNAPRSTDQMLADMRDLVSVAAS